MTTNSPFLFQNTKRSFISKRFVSLFIIIGLLITYRYLTEIIYETNIAENSVPGNVNNTPPSSSSEQIVNQPTEINDDEKNYYKHDENDDEINEIDPLSTKEPEYKFRVKLDGINRIRTFNLSCFSN